MSALTAVLDQIARAVLGDTRDSTVALGAVALRPHQLDALRRVRTAIAGAGGALLADEPGLGKTFVALALAREFPATIVVAPAALRTMWREAARSAGVLIAFVAMETLSRREVPYHEGDGLVIIDEAHHVSNPAVARYARLARMTAYKKVLLLSATPVRNSGGELAALLALFMGGRAHVPGAAARSACIIRRTGDSSLIPEVDGPHWHRMRSAPRLRAMIATLPPPLPALDGREARALLRMTLARCWASSIAALDAALRRRVQRGAALHAILESGRLPTRAELRTWVIGDDAVQLAFPILAANSAPDAARLREILDLHLDAVEAIRAAIRPRVERDAADRAGMLLELRKRHDGARIVAFTAHAATAEAVYGALRREPGVALLTSRGARTAGGARSRAEVIAALGSGAAHCTRDDISLVIATDLLSEGVNLQGASVIVHLDVPWTPAGLEQRVGRAARMGSHHARVHVHGIAPAAEAEQLLTLERRLTRKHAEQVGATHVANVVEQLRNRVRPWLHRVNLEHSVAHVEARRDGFIAILGSGVGRTLTCGTWHRGRWRIGDAPEDLLDAAATLGAARHEPDRAFENNARIALERWLANRRAREAAGAATAPTRGRRSLHAEIDSLSRQAPAHARAACAYRIRRVRALIDQAISAGAERILDELARDGLTDLEALLCACESRLKNSSSRAERTVHGDRSTIRALLLLRRPL